MLWLFITAYHADVHAKFINFVHLFNNAIGLTTRKLCYRKDDRAMRPIYRLFYHNFVHAYFHYFVQI